MKALVKTGGGVGFSYADVAVPIPGPGEALIKVNATGACGSDIHTYLWDPYAESMAARMSIRFPFVGGHEYAGTVDKVGPDVRGVAPGDRVAMETHIFCGVCFHCLNGMAHNCTSLGWYGVGYGGSFAEYCVAPARVLFKLPDKFSFEEGALFEPAGVAMHAVEKAHIVPGDIGVVLGAGPIGLIAIQILSVSGAARIIAVDLDDYRLSLAERYGAIPLNPTKVDVVAEVRKNDQAQAWCGCCARNYRLPQGLSDDVRDAPERGQGSCGRSPRRGTYQRYAMDNSERCKCNGSVWTQNLGNLIESRLPRRKQEDRSYWHPDASFRVEPA